ncbi:MAG TPA: hypothetical protein VD789_04350 [Thermomicrobiales bacterium]|nr:hypothetical protein [Thermomicrobiales bacterium]
MQIHAKRWGSIGLGLVTMLTMASATTAQEATPAGVSPDADQCTFEPRTIEDMQALFGTPAPEGAGEATSIVQATPADFTLPEGEPADEATVEEITAVIHGVAACYNAGDYLAGFGGVTDEFLVSQVGRSLFDEDFVAAMSAEPVPLDEEMQTVVLGVREVTVLEDGRVAALFDYHGPSPQVEGINGVETDLFIFRNVDGQWLLDESIENLEGTYGPEGIATPAA